MKVDFEYIEEARLEAGFFIAQSCEHLGISRRTWYRWQASGRGPKWAFVALDILSGRLDHLGWPGWLIHRGYMYHRDLRSKYYRFEPAHLLAGVWCTCPAHTNLKRRDLEKTVFQGADRGRGGSESAGAKSPGGAMESCEMSIKKGQGIGGQSTAD